MMKALVTVFSYFVMTSCGIPGGAEMRLQVKRYSGDGQIRTCSNVFGPGYGIDFPPFDASIAYSNSYRLSKVPQVYRIEGRIDPTLYLRFSAPTDFGDSDEIKTNITASVQIVLSKLNGEIIHSFTLPLASSVWTESRNLVGVYDLEKSRLRFDRNGSYVLHVVYTPGRTPPPAKQLYFAIDACAFY